MKHLHRGQSARPLLRLQVHRDLRKEPHQRRQRLLRHRARDPEIQQGHVLIPRRQRRNRLEAQGEHGHGWRIRCRVLQVHSDVGFAKTLGAEEEEEAAKRRARRERRRMGQRLATTIRTVSAAAKTSAGQEGDMLKDLHWVMRATDFIQREHNRWHE